MPAQRRGQRSQKSSLDKIIALVKRSGSVTMGGFVFTKLTPKEMKCAKCGRGKVSWPHCSMCHLCLDCCEKKNCPAGLRRKRCREKNIAARRAKRHKSKQ